MSALHTLVANALEAERTFVPVNHPTFAKTYRLAEHALARGVDPKVAARWAAVRVTQHVPLGERAKNTLR